MSYGSASEYDLKTLNSFKWSADRGESAPLTPEMEARRLRLEKMEAEKSRSTSPPLFSRPGEPRPKPPPAQNPMIHEPDLKPPKRRVDRHKWLAAGRTVVRAARNLGDVTVPTIDRVMDLIGWATEKGAGLGRIGMETLAEQLDVSIDTVRKAIRLLEDVGLLKTANVMRRWRRKLRRTVNAYTLALPDDGEPRARQRETRFERNIWWQVAVDLHARLRGLNTTPLRQPGTT